MISGSSIPRIMECPASEAMPHVYDSSEAAERGTQIHSALAERVAELVGPSAKAEVAIAYDVATDTARLLGYDIGRDYGELAPFEIPTTLDVLSVAETERTIVIVDWKTGHGRVTEPRKNWQLKFQALAAARYIGAGRVSAHLGFVKEADGTPHFTEPAEWDELDLARFAVQVKEMFFTVQQAKNGLVLNVKEGEWCKYCPAQRSCPAKTALIREFSGMAMQGKKLSMTITNENAARAWDVIKKLKPFVAKAEAELKEFAKSNPIDLGNGSTVREVIGPGNESLDATIATSVVADVVGYEAARHLATRTVTKQAIKDAIRAANHTGKSGSSVELDVIEEIRRRGGASRPMKSSIEEVTITKGDAA